MAKNFIIVGGYVLALLFALAILHGSLLLLAMAIGVGLLAAAAIYPSLLLHIFVLLIPLLPKLPLVEIRGYLVPIRFEDVYVALALVILGVRASLSPQRFFPQELWKWMLLFSVVVGLSLAYGLAFLDSIPNMRVGFLYWLRFVEYFSVFFLCLFLVRGEKQVKQLLFSLVCATFLVGAYGILQEFSLVPAFNTMHQTGEIVYLDYHTAFGRERLISTFAGAYDLAAFYVLVVPICLGLCFVLRATWLRRFVWLTVLLSIVCFYLSYARLPLPSMAVALALVLGFFKRKRWALGIGLLVPLPVWFFPEFVSRFEQVVQDPMAQHSFGGRLETSWRSAWLAFVRSPLLGTGPSSLHEGMGVDNLYLLLLGIGGLAGLLSFIFLIAKTVRLQVEAVRRAEGGMLRAMAVGLFGGTMGLLVNGFTADTFFASKVAFMFWFLMGLLVSARFLCVGDIRSDIPPRKEQEPLAGVGQWQPAS